MKHFKRIISVILTLMMILSSAPLSALADYDFAPAQDVSGSYTYEDPNSGENKEFLWSYTAETDTLYLDSEYVFIEPSNTSDDYLPLFYIDENDEPALWKHRVNNVVFSSRVKYIGTAVLEYNTPYETPINITFEEGSQLEYLDDYALYNVNANEIILPETVKFIGIYAFANSIIGKLSLPKNQTELEVDTRAFYYSRIEHFDFNGCVLEYIPMSAFENASLGGDFALPEGVKAIGNCAFLNTTFPEDYNFYLPSTIEKLCSGSFEGAKLKGFDFPKYNEEIEIQLEEFVFDGMNADIIDFNDANVKIIPYMAFANTVAYAIRFSSHTVQINGYAFEEAEIYADMDLPQGITAIAPYTFRNAKVSVNLPQSLKTIGSYAFSGATVNHALVFPETLETIGDYAFKNANVKSIAFSKSIKTIGNQAFYGCTTEEESYYRYYTDETSVGYNAFRNTNITVKAINSDIHSNAGVDTEQHDVSGFFDYDKEGDTTDYDLTWSYDAESDTLFLDGTVIKSFTTTLLDEDEDEIDEIYSLPLYYEDENGKEILWCGSYGNVVFGSSVKRLAINCLGAQKETANVRFQSGSQLEEIDNNAFAGAALTGIVIPDTVYRIGTSAFEDSDIKSVRLPNYTGDKTPVIESNAFADCQIQIFDFGSYSIESVSDYVFKGSTLKSLSLPLTGSRIKESAFRELKVTDPVIIPDNIETIGRYAFRSSTLSIFIGKGVKLLGSNAFAYSKIGDGFEISREAENIVFENSVFYKSDITAFEFTPSIVSVDEHVFSYCKSLTTVTAAENCVIEAFPTQLFYECSALTSVTIPNSVKTFGTYMFKNCTALRNVEFQENSQLEVIGNYDFSGLWLITSITIPASVKTIGSNAFSSCQSLKSLTFEEGSRLETIENSAFYQNGLESVSIPEGVKTIGASAFSYCKSLKTVYLPSTLESLGVSAFRNNPKLEHINIPNSITEIPNSTFVGDEKLNITIPDRVTKIGDYAFQGCTLIKNIPANAVEFGYSSFYKTGIKTLDLSNREGLSIDEGAFSECLSLETATFEGSTISFIESSTFKGCSALTSIVLPENITAIPGSFAYGTALAGEITIPETVTSIGNNAFYGTRITAVDIPSSVNSIGSYAFYACAKLEQVNFEGTPESSFTLGEFCFSGTKALKSIALPEGLVTVPTFCFDGSGVENITLPASLKTIKKAAFESSYLRTVFIPKSVVEIEEYAFAFCHKLKTVEFEEGSKLTTIGQYAFRSCEYLANVGLPEGLKTIDQYAFTVCNISRISIPASVTALGQYAFADNPMRYMLILGKKTVINDYSVFYYTQSRLYDTAGVLYGYVNSTARDFASKNNIKFLTLDGVTDPEEYFEEGTGTDKTTYGTCENGDWYFVQKSNVNCLYIEGSGDITSCNIKDMKGNEKTFASVAKEFGVERVYVGTGITAIPNYFMYDEEGVNIKYVCLPNTLESIGKYAFAKTGIKSIFNSNRAADVFSGTVNSYIPSGVNHIGKYAFAWTDNLEGDFKLSRELTEISEGLFYASHTPHVEMYGKVTKIGKKAFAECDNLMTLYVPCSVTEIYEDGDVENNAFGYVGSMINADLWVAGRNGSAARTYCNQNGIHFSVHLGLPYRNGCFRNTANDFNGKLNWEYYAEDNSLIISSPDKYLNNKLDLSVTTDFKYFYEYVPDTDKTSLAATISGEEDYGLMNLHPDKVVFDRITEYTAPGLLSAFNPKEVQFNYFMKTLGARTFANCERLEKVELPTSLLVAGPYCFYNCKSLKQVRMGYGMSYLAEGIFSECRSLESVDLGNIMLQSIFAKAFYNCSSLKFINLGNAISARGYIGEQAFYNCVNLQEINIPDNIREVRAQAFYNCVQVQRLNISGKVETIGKEAFANLFYCENITVNSVLDSVVSSANVFANLGAYTNGIELNIGDGVENADFKFFGGLNITQLNLGNGVETLENKQYLQNLKAITVGEESELRVNDNCLYSGNKLILVPQALTQVSIENGTTEISDYAVYATKAKSIILPDSVIALGEYCFAGSDTLIGITLSDNIIEIPDYAFTNSEKLRLLNVPERTVKIGKSAFENCKGLVNIVFGSSLQTIGENAFKGCSKIEGIAFPEDLVSIEKGAFSYCSNLKYVYIWQTAIGRNAFANDGKLNIFTLAGSDAYRYAREYDIPYSAYVDEDLFFDEWAVKVDVLAGYLGYCEEDGHGNIQYLTVYEADCENDGYIIGVCEYCSEILEEIHTDAYGHIYKVETNIPATATTRGIKVCTCERCNQSYTEYTSPLDESFEAETHTVSGYVQLSANGAATEGISPAKNASIVIDDMVVAKTDDNGYFSFELETGAYQAQVRYAYGFTRNIYILVINRDIRYIEPIVIIGCDFSKDGIINDEDIKLFQMLISAKKDDPSYLAFVDMNSDGYINAKDLMYIRACSGLEASSFKYPQIIVY